MVVTQGNLSPLFPKGTWLPPWDKLILFSLANTVLFEEVVLGQLTFKILPNLNIFSYWALYCIVL
jgi:hypothetical protein